MEPCHTSTCRYDIAARAAQVRNIYEKLKKEDGSDWLHLIPADNLLPQDDEGVVDGAHPNDYGMRHMAETTAETLRHIVGAH